MIRSEMVASRTEVVAEHGVVVGGHMQEAEAGVGEVAMFVDITAPRPPSK